MTDESSGRKDDRAWLPLTLREAVKCLSEADRAIVASWYWRTSSMIEMISADLERLQEALERIAKNPGCGLWQCGLWAKVALEGAKEVQG